MKAQTSLVAALAVAFLAATAVAQDSVADKIKAIQKDYQTAISEYSTAMRAAKTTEERAAVAKEKAPDRAKFAARYMEIAEKDPKNAAVVEALVSVAQMDLRGENGAKAIDLLAAHHIESPKLTPLVSILRYAGTESADKLLRAIADKSPDRDAKANATLALANSLKGRDAAAAEKIFNQIVEQFADVTNRTGTMGDLAKEEIKHLQKFGAGKPAPEIAGTDIDGKDFKLSDYRGKVVMLDFWGDW
jgi:hypothetical protein